MDSGADVITGGNHTFRRREFYEVLDETPYILRPANYPASAPGRGLYVVDKGRYQLAVINPVSYTHLLRDFIVSPGKRILHYPSRRTGTPGRLESPRKGFHPPPVGFGGFWYTEAVFLYYERPPRLRERLIVVEYTT